jgi:hypothetical protein
VRSLAALAAAGACASPIRQVAAPSSPKASTLRRAIESPRALLNIR